MKTIEFQQASLEIIIKLKKLGYEVRQGAEKAGMARLYLYELDKAEQLTKFNRPKLAKAVTFYQYMTGKYFLSLPKLEENRYQALRELLEIAENN